MLVVRAQKVLGQAELRSVVVLARGLWANAYDRRGLRLDTRQVPASRSAPRGGTCVLLILHGVFTVHGEDGFVLRAPVAVVMSEQHLDGAAGRRTLTYATDGERFSAVELHIPQGSAPAPPSGPRRLDIAEYVWLGPVSRVLENVRDDGADDVLEHAFAEVVRALADARIVYADVAAALAGPLRLERLYRAVQPLARRLALSTTLGELAASTGTSPRQFDRYFRSFFSNFSMVENSWRGATVFLRLRLAVLFLTAEGVTIAEVARSVGYGSTAAMGRAFQDAGLPAPSVVRDCLLRPTGDARTE